MSNEDATHENPYAAPQAELVTSKPKVVYVLKFNGRLAFWSSLAIGLVLMALFIPTIQTHRTPPPTIRDDIFRYSIIALVSIGLGLFLGSISGTPEPQKTPAQESEEFATDDPTN